jgi:2-keto-myo-inositol isomerase
VSSATIQSTDILADLAIAHDAGFDALEIGALEVGLYLASSGTLGELQSAFARAGVEPLSLAASRGCSSNGEQGRAGGWHRWEVLCERAAALGCAHVVAHHAMSGGAPQARSTTWDCLDALHRMARIATAYGVRVGVELRGARGAPASTVAAAREIVESVDDQAVGLIIDAFDFYAGGSTWAMLDGLDPRRVLTVRLEDAEPRPLRELTDAHRRLPGDGVIPLRELVRRLEEIGYDGVYSIELHRPAYSGWEPLRLARAARESIEALCAELDEQDGRLDYA